MCRIVTPEEYVKLCNTETRELTFETLPNRTWFRFKDGLDSGAVRFKTGKYTYHKFAVERQIARTYGSDTAIYMEITMPLAEMETPVVELDVIMVVQDK